MSRHLSRIFKRTTRSRFAGAIHMAMVVLAVLMLFAAIYAGAYWQGAVSIRNAMADRENFQNAGANAHASLQAEPPPWGYRRIAVSVWGLSRC